MKEFILILLYICPAFIFLNVLSLIFGVSQNYKLDKCPKSDTIIEIPVSLEYRLGCELGLKREFTK